MQAYRPGGAVAVLQHDRLGQALRAVDPVVPAPHLLGQDVGALLPCVAELVLLDVDLVAVEADDDFGVLFDRTGLP